MLKAPLEITTDRLVLSRPQLADAEEMFSRYASDIEVTRYLGWPRHQSIEDTKGFLAFSDMEWNRSQVGPYLIRTKLDGIVVGSTGLSISTQDEAMTGYVLAKDAWGLGYATETLQAMVQLAKNLELRRIYGLCHPHHLVSQRVLEKCGFLRDTSWTQQFEFPNLESEVKQDAWCFAKEFQVELKTDIFFHQHWIDL